MKSFFCLLLSFLVLLSASACLKTRAQLKDDPAPAQDSAAPESAPPIKANIQDVEPKGQYAIDELKSEIMRLTGRIDDLEREKKENQNSQSQAKDDQVKKLETRINELETAQAQLIEALKKYESAAPAVDPVELLEKGKTQLKAGQYEAAIENFTTYIKVPKAKKLEDAVFYRAEARYAMKRYKDAIVDYSKFTEDEKLRKSPHVKMALYKIGLSFEALGMKDDAMGFYQELVDKFPKSPQAKKVKAKLK